MVKVILKETLQWGSVKKKLVAGCYPFETFNSHKSFCLFLCFLSLCWEGKNILALLERSIVNCQKTILTWIDAKVPLTKVSQTFWSMKSLKNVCLKVIISRYCRPVYRACVTLSVRGNSRILTLNSWRSSRMRSSLFSGHPEYRKIEGL